MHIVVTTDGSLDPDQTAALVAPHAEGSAVTVLTVIEIPHRLLADLRSVYGEHRGLAVDSDAEYVGISPKTPGVDPDFPGDDAIINQYLANQKDERTGPMAETLQQAGMEVTVEIIDGENAPRIILEYLRANQADLVVLGAKGHGRFEGMIGSTGTKVARHAPCSVLLIRD